VKSGNEAVGIWKASGDRSAMRSAPRSPVRCPGWRRASSPHSPTARQRSPAARLV